MDTCDKVGCWCPVACVAYACLQPTVVACSQRGFTPLYWAAWGGQQDVVAWLVEVARVNVLATDVVRATALSRLCWRLLCVACVCMSCVSVPSAFVCRLCVWARRHESANRRLTVTRCGDVGCYSMATQLCTVHQIAATLQLHATWHCKRGFRLTPPIRCVHGRATAAETNTTMTHGALQWGQSPLHSAAVAGSYGTIVFLVEEGLAHVDLQDKACGWSHTASHCECANARISWWRAERFFSSAFGCATWSLGSREVPSRESWR